MKQLSAIQELIENLDRLSPKVDDTDSIASKAYHEGIQWSIIVAKKYLEKEKQQIIDAFVIKNSNIRDEKAAEDYYTQTFGE